MRRFRNALRRFDTSRRAGPSRSESSKTPRLRVNNGGFDDTNDLSEREAGAYQYLDACSAFQRHRSLLETYSSKTTTHQRNSASGTWLAVP
jgi:hypothetical protein